SNYNRGVKMKGKMNVINANTYYQYALRAFMIAVAAFSVVSMLSYSQASPIGNNIAASVSTTICPIYTAVQNTILVVGLILLVLGGALYGGAHILPGQQKGSLQGYGLGMITGGVVGVILALSASTILALVTGKTVTCS
ncbi:MAG: hypothetical protein QXD11_00005, partial [Candidatus Micrarchaeaceae archaeon]